MPTSVRLKPEIEHLLAQASRRTRKRRSALIHEALAQYLVPRRARLGDVIRQALAESAGGFGIERNQPRKANRRNWGR